MEPGFFLDLAENTGNNFYYFILSVNKYCDVPLRRYSITLGRSVVRSRDIMSSDTLSCVESPEDFTFYNTHEEELLEIDETAP